MHAKFNFIAVQCSVAAYDNSLTVYNPTLWAYESIAILKEKMVIAGKINRDFNSMVANYGDTVKTRKPADFSAKRKGLTDNVTIQDATATGVDVSLNQHVHVSFLIRDGEMSKSFKDLVTEYLEPAMVAMARHLDRVVLGQYPQFLANNAGQLKGISSTTARNFMVDAGKVLNQNLAPDDPRYAFWSPNSQAEFQKVDLFKAAYSVGDNGEALRKASVGTLFGLDNYMSQNIASFDYAAPITGAINLAAGYAAGTTSFTVDGLSAALTAGTYVTIAGDDTPLRVVSSTGGATPTAMVVTPATKRAVLDNAVLKFYSPLAVNLVAGYAAGYDGTIVYDGSGPTPKVGQLVTFTTAGGALYTVIAVTSTLLTLDRPLEVALVDDQAIFMAPQGDYNLVVHRNAMTLVIRPLALPMNSTGVSGFVANDPESGLTMRAVMTYDGNKQGHLVTLDYLMGVKVLDSALGCVVFG